MKHGVVCFPGAAPPIGSRRLSRDEEPELQLLPVASSLELVVQVVVEEEVGVMGQVLRLQVMEGRGGGQRRRHERRWERGDGRHGAGGGFWVAVGEVVQVVVVVLGEVVSRLHVRVVHDLLLAVLRVVVEDGGQYSVSELEAGRESGEEGRQPSSM
ncbi:hypothetical protein EYF80_033188 [Liparis tanakae]|uniref:Uncharacterized protein n=1 Tax=Liparis tanakae TaxID=230148 RepID=A0A4Z2GTL3_9TELE|nr:hypothetical protein EYF80_033188 [Liparis tanakae]